MKPKPERFVRMKSVVASGAIALVVAALVIGASSLVLGPKSASSEHLGFDLASGSSSFTITSTTYTTPSGTYPAATCSGAPALLYPGVTRCVVFSVHNSLSVPITVESISSALDPSYPAPPLATCSGSYLTLPTFTGSLTVPGGGDATSPGVPIVLQESGTDQSACENYTYHFTYSGGAQYTDSTSTSLTSAPNPSNSGQSVTFTATVTAGNPSTDTNPPSGPVSFYKCPSNTPCTPSAPNLLGTGTISGGVATFATTSLAVGTSYVEAVYPASGTDFTGNTSNVVTQTVNSGSIATTSVLTSSANPSVYGTSVTFTDTVSASKGTPAGTVTFYSCTTSTCSTKTSLGTGTLASGKATYSTATLPAGTTYVEAVYPASGNYLGSTSNVVSQKVNALGTTSVLTSSANPSVYGTSVTFTDTISASKGTPTGTVTFYSCTTSTCSTKTSLGTGTLASGKATYSTATLPAGITYVEAVYPASGNYLGSTSNVVSQKVNKAGASLVLSASPNPSHFGQAITLNTQSTPGTGPKGTVSFYQGAPPTGFLIGTATLNASGQATLVTKALPPGTYSIYAVYSGNTNFVSSQSNTLTVTVGYSSPCLTGTISGGYTVTSGQSICITGKVSGGVSVQSGGALFLNGANVSGGISSTGAGAIRFCGSTITGSVTISGTAGFVMIGDGGEDGIPVCAGNVVTGTVAISNNTGGIEVGGNTINGTLSVSGNTGGSDSEIEGNRISASLQCATSNNPALDNDGQRNTVGGSRTGQCSARSF